MGTSSVCVSVCVRVFVCAIFSITPTHPTEHPTNAVNEQSMARHHEVREFPNELNDVLGLSRRKVSATTTHTAARTVTDGDATVHHTDDVLDLEVHDLDVGGLEPDVFTLCNRLQ